VHVAGEPVTIAESPLPRLLQDLPEGEPVLLTGRAAERIIAWARDARPDVVVAASHAGRIEGVLGSTTRRLATSAPCPALILPPGVAPSAEADGGPAPYAHIACCIDRSPASLRALAEAQRLRALGPGRLSLVHVSPRALIEAPAPGAPAGAPRDLADDERAWLHATAAGVAGAEPVALTGLAPGAAVDWAREAHPDLIVAAAHRGPVERALLGSFAAHVAREAPCPVLLTR
jgi:nucleotide-binding universal stress UspA family protein